MAKKTIHRSFGTGKIVKESYAESHRCTTETERVRVVPRGKGKK